MGIIILAFFAGILTVLAPCVFTLLPVILGGTLSKSNWKRPALIIGSLLASIFIFTLILKASTFLIDIPATVWTIISGGIILCYGLILIFPDLWERFKEIIPLNFSSGKLLQGAKSKEGLARDIALGAALGPVFSSCSPTYTLIIATILPASFAIGISALFAYLAGLGAILMAISILGQSLIQKLKWAVDPNSKFKKGLGIILVIVGMVIIFGLDKKFETFILDQGYFNSTNIEYDLLEQNYE